MPDNAMSSRALVSTIIPTSMDRFNCKTTAVRSVRHEKLKLKAQSTPCELNVGKCLLKNAYFLCFRFGVMHKRSLDSKYFWHIYVFGGRWFFSCVNQHTYSLPLFRLDPDTDDVVSVTLALEDVGPQAVLALGTLGLGIVRAEQPNRIQGRVVKLARRHGRLQDVASASKDRMSHRKQCHSLGCRASFLLNEAGNPSEEKSVKNCLGSEIVRQAFQDQQDHVMFHLTAKPPVPCQYRRVTRVKKVLHDVDNSVFGMNNLASDNGCLHNR